MHTSYSMSLFSVDTSCIPYLSELNKIVFLNRWYFSLQECENGADNCDCSSGTCLCDDGYEGDTMNCTGNYTFLTVFIAIRNRFLIFVDRVKLNNL